MKNLSRWGKNNPMKTRFIITISYIIMGINLIGLSLFFFSEGLNAPLWSFYASITVFFASFLFYPIKRRKQGVFKHSYAKQKTFDGLLITSAACALLIGMLNLLSFPIENTHLSKLAPKSIVYKTAFDGQREIEKAPKEGFSFKKKVKSMRKEIKANLREIKKAVKAQKGSKKDGGAVVIKALLVMLIIAVSIGLGFLVAALACSVACSSASGSGVGALAVLVLGWLAIAFLAVLGVRAIVTKL